MFQEDLAHLSYSFMNLYQLFIPIIPVFIKFSAVILPLNFLLWALVTLCLIQFLILLFLSW